MGIECTETNSAQKSQQYSGVNRKLIAQQIAEQFGVKNLVRYPAETRDEQ